jgi:hypothetical protein
LDDWFDGKKAETAPSAMTFYGRSIRSNPNHPKTLTWPFWIPTTRYHRFTGGRVTTSSSNRKSGPSCLTEKDSLSCIKLVWKEEHINGLRTFYWLIMKKIV